MNSFPGQKGENTRVGSATELQTRVTEARWLVPDTPSKARHSFLQSSCLLQVRLHCAHVPETALIKYRFHCVCPKDCIVQVMFPLCVGPKDRIVQVPFQMRVSQTLHCSSTVSTVCVPQTEFVTLYVSHRLNLFKYRFKCVSQTLHCSSNVSTACGSQRLHGSVNVSTVRKTALFKYNFHCVCVVPKTAQFQV